MTAVVRRTQYNASRPPHDFARAPFVGQNRSSVVHLSDLSVLPREAVLVAVPVKECIDKLLGQIFLCCRRVLQPRLLGGRLVSLRNVAADQRLSSTIFRVDTISWQPAHPCSSEYRGLTLNASRCASSRYVDRSLSSLAS